ncbi:MAG: hypothetical protein ACU0DK_07435 [Pseudooceanicola sp.]
MRVLPPLLAILALLPACTELPPVDRTIDAAAKNAPYPDLVPTETLTSLEEAPARLDEDTAPDLQARGDRLRRTAQELRNR